jgi:hypothetical protein
MMRLIQVRKVIYLRVNHFSKILTSSIRNRALMLTARYHCRINFSTLFICFFRGYSVYNFSVATLPAACREIRILYINRVKYCMDSYYISRLIGWKYRTQGAFPVIRVLQILTAISATVIRSCFISFLRYVSIVPVLIFSKCSPSLFSSTPRRNHKAFDFASHTTAIKK